MVMNINKVYFNDDNTGENEAEKIEPPCKKSGRPERFEHDAKNDEQKRKFIFFLRLFFFSSSSFFALYFSVIMA